MPAGQPLDTLAARWAADPHPTVCAALADGLRKRGDLRGALALLNQGTDRYSEHLPLWLTLARTAIDIGDTALAETALARALMIDAHHPVVLDLATATAPTLLGVSDDGDPLCFEEEGDGPAAGPDAPVLVTESLAALYHRQGHLDLALAAYAELAARDPGNSTVADRHAAVQQEFRKAQPLPFGASETGGRSTGEWLAALARVQPGAVRPAEFDAFYQPPPAPPEATGDFSAFRRWLQELDR